MTICNDDFPMEEKLIGRDVSYRGRVVTLAIDRVTLPSGKEAIREVVIHKKAVAILPITPLDEVILIRQYRHPAKEVLFEIPAGLIEEGEDPAYTAGRELMEEIGFRAATMQPIYHFYTSPGFCDEEIFLFLATDLTPETRQGDDDEWTAPVKIHKSKLFDMMSSGEIKDAKTILAICWWLASGEAKGQNEAGRK